MLEFYRRLARTLFPVRWLFWLLGAIGAAGFALSLFGRPEWRVEAWNVLAMTLLLWAVLGAAVVYGFSAPLPEAAGDAGRTQRLWAGLRRGALFLFALFVSGLGLAVVFSTVRALGMLLRATGG